MIIKALWIIYFETDKIYIFGNNVSLTWMDQFVSTYTWRWGLNILKNLPYLCSQHRSNYAKFFQMCSKFLLQWISGEKWWKPTIFLSNFRKTSKVKLYLDKLSNELSYRYITYDSTSFFLFCPQLINRPRFIKHTNNIDVIYIESVAINFWVNPDLPCQA